MRTISTLSPNLSSVEGRFIGLKGRQARLLAQLTRPGSRILIAKKLVSIRDLGALTAACSDEFALFTLGGQRLLVRGDQRSIWLTPRQLQALATAGYRFSGHSHPRRQQQGDVISVSASDGDRAVLHKIFSKQKQSVIIDSGGNRNVFGTDPGSDTLILPEG
jgi:hypothetical protein